MNQKFLFFNKSIVSKKYWKEINRETRNRITHSYFGYDSKFYMTFVPFIFVDLYILIRSLWHVSVINWDVLEILENIYSKGINFPLGTSTDWENLKNSNSLNNHLLDHIFSLTIKTTAGSGFHNINIKEWSDS